MRRRAPNFGRGFHRDTFYEVRPAFQFGGMNALDDPTHRQQRVAREVYERVLPFYEALGVELGAILADNGRESCGTPQEIQRDLDRFLAYSNLERGLVFFTHRAPAICSLSR